MMRHKTREMLVSQRTQLLNGLRGHLTEVGVIAAQAREGFDVKVLKDILRLRKLDKDECDERQSLLDLYLSGYGERRRAGSESIARRRSRFS
jgi:transposase